MMVRLTRYIHSYVKMYVRSLDIARVFNGLAKENIYFFIEKNADNGVYLCVFKEDYNDAVVVITKANAQIMSTKKIGARFIFKKGWQKIVVSAVFLMIVTTLILIQSFVLQITITGYETLAEEDIMDVLNDIGIDYFTYAPTLNSVFLQEKMMVQIPKLGFVAINKKGWSVEVIVSEREVSEVLNDETPCNIIASNTGVITYINHISGQLIAKENTAVKKGDLLVSGVVETKYEKTYLTHSDSYIYAEIEEEKTYMIDISKSGNQYYENDVQKNYLNLFGLKIPLFFAFFEDKNYTYTTEENIFSLFSFNLPIGIVSEYRDYYTVGEKLTIKDAKYLLTEQMDIYESDELHNDTIISRKDIFKIESDIVYLTSSFVLSRNIAEKVAIVNP